MSQKSPRRSRRHTYDEETASNKSSTPKPETPKPETPNPEPIIEENAAQEPTEKESSPIAEPETNGDTTPTNEPEPETEALTNGHEELNNSNKEEMDSLIVTDEPDPELVFEENSDLESGKESPVLSRCKTRRSLTRNIPTPKTPRMEEEEAPVEREATPIEEEKEEELNNTFSSCTDDVSTKAQVGGDSTRLDYTETYEMNSFLQGNKDKSFGEALRRLSTRRTIRPIGGDFRRMKNGGDKNDIVDYPKRYSVERVSVGSKRRNGSEGDEESSKRFKSDSPGFFARFTSPLANIKNPFRGEVASSTPKLTGYKDDNCMLEKDGVSSQVCEVQDGERRWCSIM